MIYLCCYVAYIISSGSNELFPSFDPGNAECGGQSRSEKETPQSLF